MTIFCRVFVKNLPGISGNCRELISMSHPSIVSRQIIWISYENVCKKSEMRIFCFDFDRWKKFYREFREIAVNQFQCRTQASSQVKSYEFHMKTSTKTLEKNIFYRDFEKVFPEISVNFGKTLQFDLNVTVSTGWIWAHPIFISIHIKSIWKTQNEHFSPYFFAKVLPEISESCWYSRDAFFLLAAFVGIAVEYWWKLMKVDEKWWKLVKSDEKWWEVKWCEVVKGDEEWWKLRVKSDEECWELMKLMKIDEIDKLKPKGM